MGSRGSEEVYMFPIGGVQGDGLDVDYDIVVSKLGNRDLGSRGHALVLHDNCGILGHFFDGDYKIKNGNGPGTYGVD